MGVASALILLGSPLDAAHATRDPPPGLTRDTLVVSHLKACIQG